MTKIRMLKTSIVELDLRTAREPAKRAASIYASRAWLGLMAKLKRERGNKCEECGRTNCKIYGDHVIELQDGGPALDPKFVKLLCAPCHGAKTARRRVERQHERLVRTSGERPRGASISAKLT